MTGPNDSSGTRPISVAELLAKNGTIGAPPVGGRRRRRRGNTDAVTVAELTGEIPIISDRESEVDPAEATGRLSTNGTIERTSEPDVADDAAPEPADVDADVHPDVEADPDADDVVAHLDDGAEPLPLDVPDHRPHYAHALRRHPAAPADSGAEEMSPDPLDDLDSTYGEVHGDDVPVDLADPDDADDDELPSYLRSSQGTLFGGQTVADDLARRRSDDSDLGLDLDDETDETDERVEPDTTMSAFLRGAWVVGQCILAVAFGAGLFVAFDQLWKWNNIVALVLSVLVILGLVVGVRVVRKTEDIGSTLIAVAVGALVTLGPLALLQSG
jgi:hypothetical protein